MVNLMNVYLSKHYERQFILAVEWTPQNSSTQHSSANKNVLQPKLQEKKLRNSENKLPVFEVQGGTEPWLQAPVPYLFPKPLQTFCYPGKEQMRPVFLTEQCRWLPRVKAGVHDQCPVSFLTAQDPRCGKFRPRVHITPQSYHSALVQLSFSDLPNTWQLSLLIVVKHKLS